MRLLVTKGHAGGLARVKLIFSGLFWLTFLPVLGQEINITERSRKWYVPKHLAVQFAGNTGVLAVGPGYRIFEDKIQADLLYGYTPAFEADAALHALTLKLAAQPWLIDLNNHYQLAPLKIGLGVNYSFGDQFFTVLPDHYPEGYYWWASSVRLLPFIGTTLGRKVGNAKTFIQKLEIYTELGTYDLVFVSWFTNKKLPLGNILNLSVGTKFILK